MRAAAASRMCASLTTLLAALLAASLFPSARAIRITPSDLGLPNEGAFPPDDDERAAAEAGVVPSASEEARIEVVRSLRQGSQSRQRRRSVEAASFPADHLVAGLPLLDESARGIKMYAGHLNASPDGHKRLFYWLVAPPEGVPPLAGDGGDDDIPLLVWLNGGPGCSSMEGFFLENGPLRFALSGEDGDDDREWRLEANPHSWHLSPAWVLYVDQPVGTGLSFTTRGDYCKNDGEVNRDFVYFLEEFLLLHRETFLSDDGGGEGDGPPRMRRPLYFSGESHAGHYIPSMVDHILDRQEPPRGDGDGNPQEGGAAAAPPPSSSFRVWMDVRGAAIGNGWTDPYHQYAAAEAAYGAGLVGMAQQAHLDEKERECQGLLDKGNLRSGVCFELLDAITAQSHGSSGGTVACKYDVSKYLPRGGADLFPPGHQLVDAYLGSHAGPPEGKWDVDYKAVLAALRASESVDANQRYKGCTDPPYMALAHQDGLGVVPEVVRILDHPSSTPVRLLFFNGMNDLVCNHVGNEAALQKLPWGKADKWAAAPRFAWKLDDGSPPVGFMQEAENLSFLKIPNAGHMVPMDQPVVALEMIRTFVYGMSFQSSKQNMAGKAPTEELC